MLQWSLSNKVSQCNNKLLADLRIDRCDYDYVAQKCNFDR